MSTHANMVWATAASPGTGTITVSTAVSGYRTFAQGYNNADATVAGIRIEDAADPTIWEVARNCSYTYSTNALTRGTFENSSTGSAVNFTGAVVVSVVATAGGTMRVENGLMDFLFGTGVDGDATISTTVAITSDKHYRNLTLTSGGALQVGGTNDNVRIFVSGVLDLTACGAGAIACIPRNGVSGNANSGTTGGSGVAGGGAVGTLTAPGSSAGGNSGHGGSSAGGAAGTAGTAVSIGLGGRGGAGGNGSKGWEGSGPAGGAAGAVTTAYQPVELTHNLSRGLTAVLGGAGGGGGAGGSGGGIGNSSGGGGGSGGGVLQIFAHTLLTGGSTPAGAVTANGGNGGLSPACTNAVYGSGGGGGGGGGGAVLMCVGERIGSAVTDLIHANGGTGGDSDTDTGGEATGCRAGTGGNGGYIVYRSYFPPVVTVTNSTNTAATTASGATGTSGATCKVTV